MATQMKNIEIYLINPFIYKILFVSMTIFPFSKSVKRKLWGKYIEFSLLMFVNCLTFLGRKIFEIHQMETDFSNHKMQPHKNIYFSTIFVRIFYLNTFMYLFMRNPIMFNQYYFHQLLFIYYTLLSFLSIIIYCTGQKYHSH